MTVDNILQTGKNKLEDIRTDLSQVAGKAKAKTQEVISEAAEGARDIASNLSQKATETASAAVHKTNEGIAAVGHQMTALGESVRHGVSPRGALGPTATAVADNLQAGGRYLEGHGLQEMGQDVTTLIRQYPVQSVLAGFGLGCLLGMAWHRR